MIGGYKRQQKTAQLELPDGGGDHWILETKSYKF